MLALVFLCLGSSKDEERHGQRNTSASIMKRGRIQDAPVVRSFVNLGGNSFQILALHPSATHARPVLVFELQNIGGKLPSRGQWCRRRERRKGPQTLVTSL